MANVVRRSIFVTPLGMFLSIWFVETAYWAFRDPTVVENAASVVGTGVVAFLVGCLIVSAWRAAMHPAGARYRPGAPVTDRLRQLCAIAFVVYVALFYLLVWRTLNGQPLGAFRDQILSGELDPGPLFRLYSLYGFAVVFFVTFLCVKESQLRKRPPVVPLMMLVVVTYMSMSRTLMLIGLTIFAVAHTVRWGLKAQKLVLYALCATALFMLAFLASGRLVAGDSVLNLLEVYLMGGIRGLSYFVQFDQPRYTAMLTFPRVLYDIFCQQGGCSFPIAPPYYDFVETPVVQNIYTAFYPPLHDYGLIGVAVEFFLIGWIAQYSYGKSLTGRTMWMYIHGFILYAIIMSIFDDQFIRALPVFLMGLFAFWFYEALARLLVNKR